MKHFLPGSGWLVGLRGALKFILGTFAAGACLAPLALAQNVEPPATIKDYKNAYLVGFDDGFRTGCLLQTDQAKTVQKPANPYVCYSAISAVCLIQRRGWEDGYFGGRLAGLLGCHQTREMMDKGIPYPPTFGQWIDQLNEENRKNGLIGPDHTPSGYIEKVLTEKIEKENIFSEIDRANLASQNEQQLLDCEQSGSEKTISPINSPSPESASDANDVETFDLLTEVIQADAIPPGSPSLGKVTLEWGFPNSKTPTDQLGAVRLTIKPEQMMKVVQPRPGYYLNLRDYSDTLSKTQLLQQIEAKSKIWKEKVQPAKKSKSKWASFTIQSSDRGPLQLGMQVVLYQGGHSYPAVVEAKRRVRDLALWNKDYFPRRQVTGAAPKKIRCETPRNQGPSVGPPQRPSDSAAP